MMTFSDEGEDALGLGSSHVPEFAARISFIAQQRARTWGSLEQLWTGDPRLVEQIRSGVFGTQLREFFQEIGQEPLAHGALMSLDVFSRGARRRNPQDDLQAFQQDHQALLGDSAYLEDIRGMKRLCSDESAAWAAGNLNEGRACRRREFEILEGELERGLVERGRYIINHAQTHVWRTLARLMLAFLATETGHQQSLQTT